jgi:outer membrane protein OmpA-like peptidoglycan-associated protein
MSTTAVAGREAGAGLITRLWVRRTEPIWPFVWLGLLPVLGWLLLAAFALLPFAQDEIEAQVREQTRAYLNDHGFGWVDVAVSGQEVRLSGMEIKTGDGSLALQAAREAVCPSWAGWLACADEVDGRFTQAPAPVAMPAPAAPPTAAQSCEAELAGIVAKSEIEFTTGSAVISPRSAAVLDDLAKAAAQCPGVLRIEGHTDAVGTAEANQVLSEARAAAVRAALQQRGLAAARLRAEGYGATVPLADNATEDGRARNRRIEFHVVEETAGH